MGMLIRVQKQRSVFGTTSVGYPFNIGEQPPSDETGSLAIFSKNNPFYRRNDTSAIHRIFYSVPWTFHLWTGNRDNSHSRTVTTEPDPR